MFRMVQPERKKALVCFARIAGRQRCACRGQHQLCFSPRMRSEERIRQRGSGFPLHCIVIRVDQERRRSPRDGWIIGSLSRLLERENSRGRFAGMEQGLPAKEKGVGSQHFGWVGVLADRFRRRRRIARGNFVSGNSDGSIVRRHRSCQESARRGAKKNCHCAKVAPPAFQRVA